MKIISVEKISSNQARVVYAVEKETVQKRMEKLVRQESRNIRIPGFRPGKAPLSMLKSFFNENAVLEGAAHDLLNETITEAILEAGVEFVGRPQVDITKMEKDEDIEYTVTVDVMPDVELGEYKGLTALRMAEEVTDEKIDAEILKDRQKQAVRVDLDRPVENNDTVVIDYVGKINGEAFEGGSAEEVTLKVGSKQFIPGFEDQLIGMEVGDSKTFTVTFPENYAADLSGKEAEFEVTVRHGYYEQLPELDDEFVSDISDFDKVDDYRNAIRDRLQKAADSQADYQFGESILNTVMSESSMDIPESMITEEMNARFDYMKRQLEMQGIKMEDLAEQQHRTVDQMKEDLRDEVVNNLQRFLVVRAIVAQEGLEATDEDILDTIHRLYPGVSKQDADRMMERRRESLKETAEDYKVVLKLAEWNQPQTMDEYLKAMEQVKAANEAEATVTDAEAETATDEEAPKAAEESAE